VIVSGKGTTDETGTATVKLTVIDKDLATLTRIDIAKSTINRRYAAGISNLFKLFIPLVDYWAIFDNSDTPRRTVASGGLKAKTEIIESVSYEKMLAYVK
jgi:hypothetical protein